jgi:hypothetical protein
LNVIVGQSISGNLTVPVTMKYVKLEALYFSKEGIIYRNL